jgi:hypothetical protein
MKKHYKFVVHSKTYGKGVQFLEFDGQWASRQVECYEDKCLSVCDQTPKGKSFIKLCDQPLHLLQLQPEDVSNENEFKLFWDQAVKLPTA